MKAALIQMSVRGSVEENLETAERLIREAAKERADIVVLPEMFCCLYTSEAFVSNREPNGGRIWAALQKAAAESNVYLVGGSMPEEEDGRIYNTCFIFDRAGTQIGRHRKVHLFDIDVKGGQRFCESDTFSPGDSYTVFDTEFGKMGAEICFDIRFHELSRVTALAGAQMIFCPAAFNMTTGPLHWETLFKSRALDSQIYVCGCAPARDEAGPYVSYGNSLIVSPWGTVMNRLDEKPAILYQEIDLTEVNSVREQIPVMSRLRNDLYELRWKK